MSIRFETFKNSVANALSVNEDSLLLKEICIYPNEDHIIIAAIADGMGGPGNGKLFSRKAVNYLEYILEQKINNIDSLKLHNNYIKSIFRECMFEVANNLNKDSETSAIKGGTTLSFSIIWNNSVFSSNIGDSPIYLCKEGKIESLYSEHTVAKALLKSGQITEKEFFNHITRNTLIYYLSNNSNIPKKVKVIETTILPSDTLLLMSDGAIGNLNENNLLSIYEQNKKTALGTFVGAILQRAVECGEKDNQTIIAIRRIE